MTALGLREKRVRALLKNTQDTKPGVLPGNDRSYYQNAYPVTAVVYGLNPLRDPDHANLTPLRQGELNCVAQGVVEYFEGALRGRASHQLGDRR